MLLHTERGEHRFLMTSLDLHFDIFHHKKLRRAMSHIFGSKVTSV